MIATTDCQDASTKEDIKRDCERIFNNEFIEQTIEDSDDCIRENGNQQRPQRRRKRRSIRLIIAN
jgi:hypothetical protein